MMQNGVLKGITKTLNQQFALPVYVDDIDQGLDNPCFLVTDLTGTNEHIVMDRYERTYNFMVQYFPGEHSYRMDCGDVKDRLFDCLEYITADGHLIKGSDMSGNINDGVLNFEVTYKVQMFRIKRTDEEPMENIDIRQRVKE